MAIPIVENSTIQNLTFNGTSISLSPPANLQDDDIILCFCAFDGSPSNIAITGFDLVYSAQEGSVTGAVLIKRANSESGNYDLSWSGSQQGRFRMIRISGCRVGGSQSNVIDVLGAIVDGVGTTATPTKITSTEIDTLVLAMVAVDRDRVDTSDFPNGIGWSQIGASNSSGGANGAGLITGEHDLASISSVDAVVFQTWASDGFTSRMFNLGSVEPSVSAVEFVNMNTGDLE